MKVKKLTSSISGASFFIALFALLSKGLGFIREVLFASIYGLSAEFDIYLIGAVIPLTLNTIILCIGQNYLIPAFHKIRSVNTSDSENFIRANFSVFVVGGSLLSLLLYIASNEVISLFIYNTSSENAITATGLFNIFIFTIPITCGISVIIAYQQSQSEFRYSIVSHIIPNLFVLIIVYFFGANDISVIPKGFVLGNLVQLMYLVFKSNELFKTLNFSFYSVKYLSKISFVSVFIIILIESIGQLYVISDRYFYDTISTGGISALNYSFNIFALPISILTISLSTAIFPKISQLYSQKKSEELVKVFNDAVIVSIGIFIPIMLLFLVYGETIIQLIFERGRFEGEHTVITSHALFFYSISIVFYAIYGIVNKLIYSIGLLKHLLLITIMGICIKMFLNFMFASSLQQNGLALSTSLSYVFFLISSLYIIRKYIPIVNTKKFVGDFSFYLFNGIISLALTKFLLSFLILKASGSILDIVLFFIFYIINLNLSRSGLISIIKSLILNLTSIFKKHYDK